MELSGIAGVLIAALTTGGALGAIISALAGRKKTQAEASAIDWSALGSSFKDLGETSKLLSEITKQTITQLQSRIECLDLRLAALEGELGEREVTIEKLKVENAALKKAITKLQTENKDKDRKIAELTEQVEHLTLRIEGLDHGI